MTQPIPFALLSPLRSDLTSLLQSKETASAAEGMSGGRRNGVTPGSRGKIECIAYVCQDPFSTHMLTSQV
jgi:hypothetical protein